MELLGLFLVTWSSLICGQVNKKSSLPMKMSHEYIGMLDLTSYCFIVDSSNRATSFWIKLNETERTSQCEQMLTTKLAEFKECNPVLVRQIARILSELATISLTQNP
jgi:hypothetical protein